MIGHGRPGAHFDMIHNHMTWNEKFVNDHMPNDTFKFSIIRHPVSHLTSSWKYFFQSTHHTSARKNFNKDLILARIFIFVSNLGSGQVLGMVPGQVSGQVPGLVSGLVPGLVQGPVLGLVPSQIRFV